MKKLRIGIPRCLLYYRYGIFYRNFFELLGCKVIISPETNENTILSNNKELCLLQKLYLGHIITLIDNCDYLFLPNINKICHQLNLIYDYLNKLISKKELLIQNNNQFELYSFLKLGFKITKNPIKIIYSYLLAKEKQKRKDIAIQNETKNKLTKPNKKVLLVSNFYNLHEVYYINKIYTYLNEHKIIYINSDTLDRKIAISFSSYLSNNIENDYLKEKIGSLYYYKNQVDGIIYITNNNCCIDNSITNLAIYKNKDIPSIKITLDDNIDDKLMSFIQTIL